MTRIVSWPPRRRQRQVGRDVAVGVGHHDDAVGLAGVGGDDHGSQVTSIMLATSDTVIMIIVLASPSGDVTVML